MNIQETRIDDRLILALEGRLDTVTAPELEAVLKKQLPTIRELVLDLEKLEYISSAGLRVLLFAQNSLPDKDGLTIRNPNELVREVFEVTGFNNMMNIV